MSSFLVSLSHIDTLIAYGALATGAPRELRPLTLTLPADITESGAPETLDFADADTRNDIGRELFRANAESLVARYGSDESSALGFALAELYSFQPTTGPADAAAIIGACDCFDYQACESDAYPMSLAQWIVSAIRAKAAAEFRQGWEVTNDERDSEVESIELNPAAAEPEPDGKGSSRGTILAKMAAALGGAPALPDTPEAAPEAPQAAPEPAPAPEPAKGAGKRSSKLATAPKPEPELAAAKARKGAKPAGRKSVKATGRDSSPNGGTKRRGNASPA
jgi:hypothetical protein